MIGAIIGDIAGSVYEKNNIKTKEFELFSNNCRYTDDSVLTCAIANACCHYIDDRNMDAFKSNVIKELKLVGLNHLNAGYGGTFIKWLISNSTSPYNSWGNGSAMRVSPIGYISSDMSETLKLAEISAAVTHNHPEGIKGAQAIASAIFLAKSGMDKESIQKYIHNNFYDLNFTIDDIRDDYKFDVSCQGSVPYAIRAFLESENFEDAIKIAISIGGDSDTIAAMSGSIAEAYYGVPENIKNQIYNYLTDDLISSVEKFYSRINLYKTI